MDTLPPEILYIISSFMNSSQLNVWSRTCKSLQSIAYNFTLRLKHEEHRIVFHSIMDETQLLKCIQHLKHDDGGQQTIKFIKVEPKTNYLLHMVDLAYRSDNCEYEHCFYYPISGYSRIGYDAQTIMRYLFYVEGHAGEIMAKLLIDAGYNAINMFPDTDVTADNPFYSAMPKRKTLSNNANRYHECEFWERRDNANESDFNLDEDHPENIFLGIDEQSKCKRFWQYVHDWFNCRTVNYANLFSRHPDTSVVISNSKGTYIDIECPECSPILVPSIPIK